MIEVKGLVKNYGNKKVLKGVNFTVEDSKICGLLGSGKSKG